MSCVHTIDTTSADCFRSFAKLRNAQVVDAEGAQGVITDVQGLTFFSGIACMNGDGGDTAERVARVIEPFQTRRAPFRWWVSPASPPDLQPVLITKGLRFTWNSAGMVADIERMRFGPMPQGLRVERMTSGDAMRTWAQLIVTVFQKPLSDADIWLDAFGQLGYGEDSQWAHFVGFLDNQPVATTSVMLAGERVGVYHVGTLAEARGKGVGSAVTLAAIEHARERGAKIAALQSSEMAESV
ncbi:MAG: GNAT family N-acetyltransferase, partial [Thermoanaerobaculia bacterium]